MGKRVLIVDASEDGRRVQSYALSSAGHEVIEAASGGQALDRLAATPVHVVVTDQRLPDLDGLALVRAIREDARHRFTPVVVITASPAGERVQEARTAGATGWLSRPFTPEQLLAAIRRVSGV